MALGSLEILKIDALANIARLSEALVANLSKSSDDVEQENRYDCRMAHH